jgi:hypothetical protein
MFCVYLLDHNLSYEYGSSIQGRSQDGARIEDFKVSLQRKYISSTYLISITSLPEDEQRLSMEEEVGTMQFRVYGEQIKK